MLIVRFITVSLLIFFNLGYSHTIRKIEKSRVIKFEYSGYDDTTCALIFGKVYSAGKMDNRGKSHLSPLANVQIQVQQNGRITTTVTDGNFVIGFNKGIFSLLITKAGYQSLRITNYISDPDQVSITRIILEKGENLQTFEIPKPKK
ncbi:MAG TPA: hypothetical protein VKR53_10080 [Puia sp.]|nr:hypothetical protein [Puia sp.]